MERTEETLKARVRETPLTDRINECRKRIGNMCAEGRAPRMCIPVQHSDDDFFICTTLADAQAQIEAVQQSRTCAETYLPLIAALLTVQSTHTTLTSEWCEDVCNAVKGLQQERDEARREVMDIKGGDGE